MLDIFEIPPRPPAVVLAVILPTVLPVINFCYKNLVKPPLSPRQAVMESCSAEPRPSTPFKRKDYNQKERGVGCSNAPQKRKKFPLIFHHFFVVDCVNQVLRILGSKLVILAV